MKKIPEIRFPEFSGEWVEKRLGEVCKIIMGQSPDSQFYNQDKNGLPLIQGANDFEKINNYTTQITKTCDKNDIIMSVRAPVGTLTKAKVKSCIGRGVCSIKGNEFIYYFLIKNKNGLKKYSQGSTFEAINSKDLKLIKINIPPTLTEQQKIAEFLSLIDEKIEIVTKKIDNLKQYKKGLLQKMLNVTDKGEPELRFKEFSGKWVENRLGELNIYISDGNYGELYPTSKEFVEYGIPFIRANNIQDLKIINKDMRYISEDKHKILISGHLKEGDILVTTRGEIGEVAYVNKEFENANINAQICLLRTNNEDIYNKYLLYQLSLNKKQFLKFQTGSALKQLPKKSLKQIKIHIPPTIEEQQKIGKFLSSIDEKIELNENKLKALKKYKQGLFQKIFV